MAQPATDTSRPGGDVTAPAGLGGPAELGEAPGTHVFDE